MKILVQLTMVNALPIMTVKHVSHRMLQPLIKQPTSQKIIEILLASLNIDLHDPAKGNN